MTARRLGLLSLPLLWTAVFVIVPLLLILKISFAEAQLAQPPYTPLFQDGALAASLINYSLLLEDVLYLRAVSNSLLYAGLATLCCLIIGLAIARAVTQAPRGWQPLLLTLIILPFWTSFLIRVYAWIALLKPEGLINAALLWLGVIDAPLIMVNTGFGVVLGMTYSYLPFAILPIYASLAGQSPRLTEAAIDLGATPIRAFWLVTVPLARPGILAAGLMVFIPMAGEFVIPDLLGGSATIMLGQTLWTEFFSNRDWPLASALAVVLTLLLLVPAMTLQRLELGKASR
ncbi:ABC transporter permease [Ferrovibrio sp.]|uniref:ABC transporter permease n=1 Tax=Ferrovibrio sp. TaxID=1917215 RepID=UPI000CA83D65|nr:ABC transporter permease subunit [Ferrovibrio sp.]PJI43300.1 MAG: putrescine ABC transporter permease PotH [Ferrovibrio sp.]